MKKLIFSISALMMCLIMTSCSKLGKLQSMADDMKENGKSWTADEWEQYLLDMADATLAFWDSEPSKEDIKEYDKINKQMERTMEKVAKGKKVQKALDKAMKKLEKNRDFKSAVRKLEKLEKKARNASKKASRRSSIDEDEEEAEEAEEADDEDDYDHSGDIDEEEEDFDM